MSSVFVWPYSVIDIDFAISRPSKSTTLICYGTTKYWRFWPMDMMFTTEQDQLNMRCSKGWDMEGEVKIRGKGGRD